MEDTDKSKGQLLQELQHLRGRVTELEAAESARQRAEQMQAGLLAILEATTDFIGIADVNRRSMYVNQAGRRMVGMGKDEPETNLSVFEHHPEWVRIRFSEILPLAAQKGVWSGETALLHRDGHEIPVSQVILAHKGPDGNVEYFSTIARDISVSKALEKQRADFLAMLAHDIRNPLSAILGYIDLLLEEEPTARPESEVGFLPQLKSNALTIMSLIMNYLDFAKVEAGHLVLHKTSQDIGIIVQNVCDQYEAVALRHRQTLQLELPDHLPCVMSDSLALERIFANLIQNALKFTPAGGHVRVSIRQAGQHLIIEVQDTGGGIAPDEWPYLFEKFHRAEFTQRHEGTGLGLFIVRKIVEAHDGRVEPHNCPAGGACFCVTLPAEATADQPEEMQPAAHPAAHPAIPS